MVNQQQKDLVTYLRKIVQSSTKIVRDVSHYEACFWMEKALGHSNCTLKSWDSLDQEKEEWLNIKRPIEPPFPPVPAVCSPWVDTAEFLEDKTLLPKLKDSPKIKSECLEEEPESLKRYSEIQNI